MRKIVNIVLSILTIALLGFYIYTKGANITTFTQVEEFILNYGALILLGCFTFNNLLMKAMGVFFVLFVIAVIVLIILFINPSLITNLFSSISI